VLTADALDSDRALPAAAPSIGQFQAGRIEVAMLVGELQGFRWL
jgi:hypothetical protein